VLRQGGDGGAQERPIICLRNVSLKFRSPRGEVAALAGVDLDVRAGEFVTVVHVPLREGPYDVGKLGVVPPGGHVDWILIDGPSGPPGCRYWTLPALRGHCGPGARWFLDDAFRDGELAILRKWRNVSGIVVEGIYPIGKGLATGRAR